jgi:DUF1016 N-terminal domain
MNYEQLLSNLAADLKAKGLKGLGVSMPKNCRQFYRSYPQIRQSVNWRIRSRLAVLPPENLLRLSWTHFIELIRIDDPLKRTFYEIECFRGNWSVRQLQRQIGSLLYERTGLSMDKEAVVRRLTRRTRPPQSPRSCGIRMYSNSLGSPNGPRTTRRTLNQPSSTICRHSSSNWALDFVSRPSKGESQSLTSTTISISSSSIVFCAATSC